MSENFSHDSADPRQDRDPEIQHESDEVEATLDSPSQEPVAEAGAPDDTLASLPNPDTRIGPEVINPRAMLSPKQRLFIALKPRLTKAQILTAVLCGLLGFALVVQMQSSQKDELAGLRQTELIGLLDEVTRRTDDLEAEERRLTALVEELQSGQNTQQVAREAAEKNAEVQGILSGRLTAQGPGVSIVLVDGEEPITAQTLFNVLEELRNAGAEAVQVNGVRLVASSYFSQVEENIVVGGQIIESPYTWDAIGDPKTIEPALEIPGGAMPQVRANGSTALVEQLSEVSIESVATTSSPEFAKPVESDN